VGSAPDEEQWPADMQALVRTRRAALTALADFVAPIDEIEADVLRARAATRVPLEWPSGDRERLLERDLAVIALAMDRVHAFLADDAARCRWARTLGLVHLTRASAYAREAEAMGEDLPHGAGHRIDALYALAEVLRDAESEWSRNTRGVAPRLRRQSPPDRTLAAPDLARVVEQLDVAQRTCGWPAP
jgi:hypothetical protein